MHFGGPLIDLHEQHAAGWRWGRRIVQGGNERREKHRRQRRHANRSRSKRNEATARLRLRWRNRAECSQPHMRQQRIGHRHQRAATGARSTNRRGRILGGKLDPFERKIAGLARQFGQTSFKFESHVNHRLRSNQTAPWPSSA